MKRLFRPLSVVVLLFSCLFFVAFSQEADAATPVEDYIYNQLIAHSETIDVSSYNIPTDQFGDIYRSVYYSHPDLFFCTNAYRATVSNSTVITVTPSYTMNKAQKDAAMIEYKGMLADIIGSMPSGMSKVDKVVWLHEYVLTAYSYDYSYSNYDAYSLMKNKVGVCESYALTLMALLQSQGIECWYRYSTVANHAWVVVNLDGNMYNVDPTWDDPSYIANDNSGKYTYLEGKHSFLLVSDAALIARDGNNMRSDAACYGCSIKCTSTKYDNAFWEDATGYMSYLGGKWYYVDRNVKGDKALVECSVSSGTIRKLSIFSEYWRPADNPHSYYPNGTYAGIGVYNNKMYVSGPKGIFVYNFVSGEMQQVYSYTGTNQIYGAKILPGSKYMTLYIDDKPGTGTYSTEQVDLSKLTVATPTPAPTVKPTATPTAKPTAPPTSTPTATPAAKPGTTATATPVSTPTATPGAIATPTAEPGTTATATPVSTPTATPGAMTSPEETATPAATATPEATANPTQNPAADNTATPVPTDEPTDDQTVATMTPEATAPTDTEDEQADAAQVDNSALIIVAVVIGVSASAVAVVLVLVKTKHTNRHNQSS